MAAGRELFKLFGLIGLQGVDNTATGLKKIDKQARRVQREIDKMGKKVSNVGKTLTKAFTTPLAAVTASVGALAVQTGKYADKILDLEQITGLTTQRLQEYEHVARAAGVSFDGFVGVISKFQGRLPQLLEGQGRAAEVMNDLGVSVLNVDGNIKDINILFPELLKKLHGVEDVTQRNAIAQQIFGRTMNDIAPVLGMTAEQLEGVTKEAHEMGLILGDQALNEANGFRIEIEKLGARAAASGRSIASGFIPIIRDGLLPLFESKIIPVFQKVSSVLKEAINLWGRVPLATKKTIAGFVLLAASVGPVVFILGKLIAFSKVLVPLFVALRAGTLSWAGAMGALSKSVLGVVAVIGSLIAIGWYYYSQWDTIGAQLGIIWERLKAALAKTAVYIADKFLEFTDVVLTAISKITKFIPGLENKLKGARVEVLKLRASLHKMAAAQVQNAAAAIEQGKSLDGFLTSAKRAIEAGKEKLGITKKQTEATYIRTQTEKEAAEAAEAAAKKEAQAAKQLADEKINFERSLHEQINSLRLTEKELLEIERQEALEEAKRLGADIYAVEELYSLKKIELKKRELEAEIQASKKSLSVARTFGGRVNNILSKFSDVKLKRIDVEEQKELAAIQKSQLTEEQKETATQKIREKFEAKRRDAEKQRAAREKMFTVFKIGLDTASAVVEALPNVPLSLFVGGLGAAEAAAAMAMPEPFYDGGLVTGSPEGVNARVGEAGQDELILPLERGVSMFVEGVLDRLRGDETALFGDRELAFAGAPSVGKKEIHLHIGAFIGDNAGLKMLERKLDTIRIAENQRKGIG